MFFADLGGGLLQDTGNEADLFGSLNGQEGCGCPADVMQCHCLAEGRFGPFTYDGVELRCGKGTSPRRRPEAVVVESPGKARPDVILSMEEKWARDQEKKTHRREAKLKRRLAEGDGQ